ncbi:MAG: MBL fold metallo-hydrolase [Janthinobacterium lividum]
MIELSQAPGYYRRRAGDVVVTALHDGVLHMGAEVIQRVPADEVARLRRAAFEPAGLAISVSAFALHLPDGRVALVDAGYGPGGPDTAGRLPQSMAAADLAPGDIDVVLLTHMHPDHIGGLLDAGGRATFARAELVVPRAEAAYWGSEAVMAKAPPQAHSTFRAARALLDAYAGRVRLSADGEAVLPGVVAEAMPGHTPGHTGYRIGAGAEAVLLLADVVHVASVQAPLPEAALVFDSDQDVAEATRRRVLGAAADAGTCVAGIHLAFPPFAHVARAGDGFAVVTEAWSDEV